METEWWRRHSRPPKLRPLQTPQRRHWPGRWFAGAGEADSGSGNPANRAESCPHFEAVSTPARHMARPMKKNLSGAENEVKCQAQCSQAHDEILQRRVFLKQQERKERAGSREDAEQRSGAEFEIGALAFVSAAHQACEEVAHQAREWTRAPPVDSPRRPSSGVLEHFPSTAWAQARRRRAPRQFARYPPARSTA